MTELCTPYGIPWSAALALVVAIVGLITGSVTLFGRREAGRPGLRMSVEAAPSFQQ